MQIQVSLKIEISASANLTEMEQQIQESGQHLMREAFKQLIRKREEEQIQCPACAGKSYRLEGTTRRVIATIFGRVEVPRRRFRCQQCLHRWCPANRLFDPLKGGVISGPLQEAAMLAGCSWPYRVAARLLKQLSGAKSSAEEIRLVLNRRGKHRAGQQQEEAERVCATPRAVAPSPDQGKPPILVGLDGGWVGSREQRGGMEGKVAVVSSQMQDLPMPTYSTTFSREPTRRTEARAETTPSVSQPQICRDLCLISTAWPTSGSRRPDAEPRREPPSGGGGRRSQLDQDRAIPSFSAGDLYFGLGAPLARSQSCDSRGRTSEIPLSPRSRCPVVAASILALVWQCRSSGAGIAHSGRRIAARVA
jgi:hypothetical protein